MVQYAKVGSVTLVSWCYAICAAEVCYCFITKAGIHFGTITRALIKGSVDLTRCNERFSFCEKKCYTYFKDLGDL